jgi:hypothetical protein
MKRGGSPVASSHIVSRRWAFFCGMLGVLMLPVMPVPFTSILTAVVWVFAGAPFAVVFIILGTYRLDAVPVYTLLQHLVVKVEPSGLAPFTLLITVSVMFLGNFAMAYLFKAIFVSRLMRRIRPIE